MEKMNKKLREELSSLNEHIATNTVSKAEIELYRKAVDEKVIVTSTQACVSMCVCTHIHMHVGMCLVFTFYEWVWVWSSLLICG